MKFGYIDCDEHGKRRKSWFICRHLKVIADVKYRCEWTETDGGTLCCEIEPEHHSADDLTLVCEEHLKELGLFELVN